MIRTAGKIRHDIDCPKRTPISKPKRVCTCGATRAKAKAKRERDERNEEWWREPWNR
jgi:hypothetical protein